MFNVLFITNDQAHSRTYLNQSIRYRCFNLAEALLTHGASSEVIPVSRVSSNVLKHFEIVVFHRPLCNGPLLSLVKAAKKHSKLLIADYDDLVFHPDFAAAAPAVINADSNIDSHNKLISQYKRCLALFDHFTVSTQPLADKLADFTPHAHIKVIRNQLSKTWIERHATEAQPPQSSPRITYLSGSKTHNNDFAKIEAELASGLEDNPDLELMIVGHLDYNRQLFPADRLIHHPKVPYEQIPQLIKQSTINLAPLASNAFNDCKSAIKCLESAIFGTAFIGSPLEDLERFEHQQIQCIPTNVSWLDDLHYCLDTQASASESLAQYMYQQMATQDQANQFCNFVKSSL